MAPSLQLPPSQNDTFQNDADNSLANQGPHHSVLK